MEEEGKRRVEKDGIGSVLIDRAGERWNLVELLVSTIVTRFFAGLIIVPRATTTLDTPAIVELQQSTRSQFLPCSPRPRTSRTWQVVSPPTLARPHHQKRNTNQRVPTTSSGKHLASRRERVTEILPFVEHSFAN